MQVEQAVDQGHIGDAAFDPLGCGVYISAKTAAEIVEYQDLVAEGDEFVDDVGTNKTGTAGDQTHCAHDFVPPARFV
jgi:hypothetical protein